jgi:1-acyl-sn-glycerol-3-phosphate acyltransferase
MFSHLYKNEKNGQEYFIKLSKIWMNVWLFLIGCSVKVYGKENFSPGENYIIVFNHNALLDVPLSAPYVLGANKTIGKASFSKVPLFGLFYKRGAILVDRKDEKSRSKSYEAMKEVLLTGMHMCIYPEGTRNRTNDKLKPFFDGAFKLSVDTRKEIIPCIINGTKEAMPIHKAFYLYPTKLSMTFLPPVKPEQLNAKELNKKVFDIMWGWGD